MNVIMKLKLCTLSELVQLFKKSIYGKSVRDFNNQHTILKQRILKMFS